MAGVLLLSASGAGAQEAAARVEPAHAEPGWDISFVFTMTSPELLEVAVQEEIECEVQSPSGQRTAPCHSSSPLVQLELLGSDTREYRFSYVAPSTLGSYTLTFQSESLLRLPMEEYTATAGFTVHPTGALPAPGGGDNPGIPGGPGAPTDPNNPGSPGSGDDPSGSDNGDQDDPGSNNGGGLFPGAPTFGVFDNPDAARMLVSSTVAAATMIAAFSARRFLPGGL